MSKRIKTKTATFSGVAAVEVACPDCGEICESETGQGNMITVEDTVQALVHCPHCKQDYALPARAITLLKR